jgi:integral membrane protein
VTGTQTGKPVEAALFRYRIAAYIVGTLLLIACSASITKHVFDGPDFLWVWFVHGWFYVVYLVLAFDLYRRTRWPLLRLVEMVLAGLLPGLTFVIERRVAAFAVSRGIGG